MTIINKINDIKIYLNEGGNKRKSIGFIPTMGALHAGHLSLIQQARKENDLVVVSIFVNPKQFNSLNDLKRYPQDIDRDKAFIGDTADVIFAPDIEEMYPSGFGTNIHISPLAEIGEGAYRPGHFDGMATVVLKLFEIVRPTRAYFGKKDYQQYLIVKQMVRDVNLPIAIVGCETVREENGLAMSSRNMRLSDEGRKQAGMISVALQDVTRLIFEGERDVNEVKKRMLHILKRADIKVEYIEFRAISNFREFGSIEESVVILLAVYVEEVRLIDNIEVHL